MLLLRTFTGRLLFGLFVHCNMSQGRSTPLCLLYSVASESRDIPCRQSFHSEVQILEYNVKRTRESVVRSHRKGQEAGLERINYCHALYDFYSPFFLTFNVRPSSPAQWWHIIIIRYNLKAKERSVVGFSRCPLSTKGTRNLMTEVQESEWPGLVDHLNRIRVSGVEWMAV